MSWRTSIRQTRREPISTTTTYNFMPWLVLAAVLVVGVPLVVLSIHACKFVTEQHIWLIGGVVGVTAIFAIFTFCYTRVLVAYSQLRSSEDAADDKRELDLLRTVAGLQNKSQVHVHPSGQQVPEWPQQVPAGYLAPPVIDYQEQEVMLE